MKEKADKIVYGLTAALLFISAAMLYMVNEKIPFMMDDLWYATRLYDDMPITSFRDIIESQVWHYFNWGGRSMTHGLLQLILLAGEKAADIFNVAAVFLLAGLICRASGTGDTVKLQRLPWLFAAVGMLLGLNANWKMSMFWQAGAANYLYITIFILGFFMCYLREIPEEGSILPWKVSGAALGMEKKPLPGIIFWIVPLGVLAGWSNENMGPAVWILSLFIIGLCIKEKRKIRAWMILGNLSCLFGSIMVIAAPGNFVRNAQVVSDGYGSLWKAFLQSYGVCNAVFNYLFPVLLLTGALVILCKCVLKISIGRRNLLLLSGALLSWGAMILSPHYPDRAAFGTMVLLLCVILSVAGKVLSKRQDLWMVFWAAALFIWLRGMFFLGEFLAICWGWIV